MSPTGDDSASEMPDWVLTLIIVALVIFILLVILIIMVVVSKRDVFYLAELDTVDTFIGKWSVFFQSPNFTDLPRYLVLEDQGAMSVTPLI